MKKMIKQVLMRLNEFLRDNRRTGHTSLLNKIGKEHDVYIIVHDMEMKRYFDSEVHDKLISITNISILQGAPHKPILFDNKVLMDLSYDTVSVIEDKQLQISRLKNVLNTIKDILLTNENLDTKRERMDVNISKTKK